MLTGLSVFMLPSFFYVVFETNSMFDFGMGFFIMIDNLNGFAVYLLFGWQLENMSEFIENCEKFIEKSE